jgi:hypothetical protein
LDVTSTTKGLLPPRWTAVQRVAISSPAASLFGWDSDSGRPFVYTGSAWKGLKYTDEGSLDANVILNQDAYQTGKRFSIRSGRFDSLYSRTSTGLIFANSSGASIGGLGNGGGITGYWDGLHTFNAGITSTGTTTIGSTTAMLKRVSGVITDAVAGTDYLAGTVNDSRLLFAANGTIKDTPILSYDRANVRVGIGTASPASSLDIRANTSNTGYVSAIFANAHASGRASFNLLNNSGNALILQMYGSSASTFPNAGLVATSGAGVDIVIGSSFNTATGGISAIRFRPGGYSEADMMYMNSSRVGIGTATPATSSILDITSTTKGFLGPRMTSAQRTAISSPATGLQVYDTDSLDLFTYNGTAWRPMSRVDNISVPLTGSNVTMTTSSTWYSGPSVTLGVGTWDISGNIGMTGTAASTHLYAARIYNGTTAISSGHGAIPNAGDRQITIALTSTPVTITSGTVTYTIQGYASQNAAAINYLTATASQPNCTYITVKRLSN